MLNFGFPQWFMVLFLILECMMPFVRANKYGILQKMGPSDVFCAVLGIMLRVVILIVVLHFGGFWI